ncbi:MAG: hypothetical protein WBB98_03935 [Xanthobacteraceae bacterium]
MDLQSEIARLERRQAEARTFCAEMRKPTPMPWPFAIGGIIVGAAIFGAGMMFAKVVGV